MTEPRPALAVTDVLAGFEEKVQVKKVGEDAARRLAEHILAEKLPVGTPLPPERELAETLGIGRGTMREALRILQIFGMIETRTGRYGGPVVSRPDADDLSVALTLSMHANGSTMLDVLEARTAIEPKLAYLAATRISEEVVAKMRETVEGMRQRSVSSRQFSEFAREFHDLVSDTADSPVLSLLASGLHSIGGGHSVGIEYGPRQMKATAKAHELIIDALEAGNSELAETRWRAHLAEAETYWRKAFPKEVQRPVRWTI